MSERNILGNRTWSATLVRLSVVLVAAGIVLMLIGAAVAAAREGLVVTGGVAAGVGVAAGIVGVIGSWASRSSRR